MKKILLVMLCLFFTFTSTFASGQNESADGDLITLKWQVWITPNLGRAFYDEVAAAYMAGNPGVKIEIVETSAAVDSNANNFMKMRLASGDVPDIWSSISDPSFLEAGHVWELPADDPDLKKINNPLGYAYNGKIYGLGTSIQPQGAMFYNKALWRDAGLTEADIPRTFTEFDAVCAQLKEAGITPILTGGEWVPFATLSWLSSAEIGVAHPSFWKEYREGQIRFSDPEIFTIFEWIDSLVKKEYFNKGALSIGYAQLEREFLNGKAAMYPMGTWFTAAESNSEKDWETGVFVNPSINGNINFTHGGGYGSNWIYSGSENPEEAYAFLKWFSIDSEYAVEFLQADGLYSNLIPALEYEMTPLQKDVQNLVSTADITTALSGVYLGGPAPSGIDDIYGSLMEVILLQSYSSLAEEVQKIDDYIIDLEEL